MPLSQPAEREELHTRSIVIRGYRRRDGLYDIEVTNQRGDRVAMVRGRSHRMKDREVVPLSDACFAAQPLPTK